MPKISRHFAQPAEIKGKMPQGQAKMSHCNLAAPQAFSPPMRVPRDIHGLAGRKGPAAC
jgi:hypothetical protein